MSSFGNLIETLPVLQRFALTYAPASSRAATLALLALDTRLAGVVRSASEPMLAQLRLAWWRETLAQDADALPEGEPLLANLKTWGGHHRALGALVDGWEAMTGKAPLGEQAMRDLADGRGTAFLALAEAVGEGGHADVVRRLTRNWALADIASRLSLPEERNTAFSLAKAQDWRRAKLPRALRPLIVLHGLAGRAVRRGDSLNELTPAAFLPAIRLGLLGR